MNFDQYYEIINGDETYEFLASVLKQGRPFLIGWTDGRGTHFDILFNLRATVDPVNILSGNIQGGIRHSDLFVSIMRLGAFGFEVDNINTSWQYYDEKLSGHRMGETTAIEIAKLINGIKKEILKPIKKA